mgnify:CR=1 FL=1
MTLLCHSAEFNAIEKIWSIAKSMRRKNLVTEEDLIKIAKEEGWILEPDNSNIDKPLGDYDKD